MSLTTDMMDGDRFTPEQIASRELLRMMVAREVFCPISGALLDNRTAVLVEAADDAGNEQTAIMAPEVYAKKAPEVAAMARKFGLALTITEGAA